MSRSDQPLSRVLEENATFVHSLARALVGDIHAANDLAQETWLTALACPPRHTTNVRSWLGTVVERLASRSRRATSRRLVREITAARPESEGSGSDELAWREVLRRVTTAVLTLEEPYQETVLLRYYEGLNASEIATRTGVQAGTVRVRLKRALDSLRTSLDKHSGGDRQAWMRAFVPLVGVGRIGSVASGGGLAAGGGALVMGTTAKITVGLITTACIGAAGWQGLRMLGPPEQLAAAPELLPSPIVVETSRSDMGEPVFREPMVVQTVTPDVPGVVAPVIEVPKTWTEGSWQEYVKVQPLISKTDQEFESKYKDADGLQLVRALQVLKQCGFEEKQPLVDLRTVTRDYERVPAGEPIHFGSDGDQPCSTYTRTDGNDILVFRFPPDTYPLINYRAREILWVRSHALAMGMEKALKDAERR